MSNVILLILSCERYRHKAEIQKNTWLRNLPPQVMYFHVIGDQHRCAGAEFVIDVHNRVLYTNTLDDYVSLPHKIITAIHAVNATFQYDYLYKTDDDQALVNPHFFSWLSSTITPYHYGGYAVDIETHHSDYWTFHSELPRNVLLEKTTYCSGRFYFLSKNAARALLQNKASIAQRVIEDHSIGYFLPEDFKQGILRMNDMVQSSLVDYQG